MRVTPNIALTRAPPATSCTFTYAAELVSLYRGQTLASSHALDPGRSVATAWGPGYVELRAGRWTTSAKIRFVSIRKAAIATRAGAHAELSARVSGRERRRSSPARGYAFLGADPLGGREPQAKFRGAASRQAARL